MRTSLGISCYQLGDYSQALDHFLNALKVFEERGDSLRQAQLLNNIGLILEEQGKEDQALEYHQQSLALNRSLGRIAGQAISLNNIGKIYQQLERLDQALDSYQQSLTLLDRSGNQQYAAEVLMNIGNIYNDRKEYDQALEMYGRSLESQTAMGNLAGQAAVLINMGVIRNQQGQYRLAVEHLEQGLALAIRAGHMLWQRNAYYNLGEVQANVGAYREAYMNMLNYAELQDTLFNDEMNRAIQEMEAKYQNEKKTLELAKQSAELKAQQQRNYFLVGVGASLMLLLIVVGYGYWDKRRMNRILTIQKQQIEQAYEEIKAQKETIEDQHQQLELAYTEIQSRNEELATSLHTIQQQQQQLIAAEKQALLGRVASGVAHELNTPLAAIQASARSVGRRLGLTLPNMPEQLLALSPGARTGFRQLLSESLDTNSEHSLTTREERARIRELTTSLEPQFGEEAQELARNLVRACFNTVPAALTAQTDQAEAREVVDHVVELRQMVTLMHNIQTSVDRTARIVQALRQLNPDDSHREPPQPLSVAESIVEVLRRYQSYLSKGIEVDRQLDPSLQIVAQEEDLWQLWTQIIFNAIQAMAERGRLTIAMEQISGEVLVYFMDTGPGIPPEIGDRVFEPLYTTKGEGEGTGIGLFVCQIIAQRYGGEVSFVSRPGETVFTVRLPAAG